jgi:putative DNA primase/helicase
MTPEPAAITTRERLTDAGNAARFAARNGAWVRYCYAWGAWLVWSGHCWRVDPGNRVMELAKDTAREIWQEAERAESAEERRHVAKWAAISESEPRLRAMLNLARSEPGIPVLPDELDTDPMLLACTNGTLDLRPPGTLRPPRREDLITKAVPVAFDPAAPCPRFLDFLGRIFDGKGEVIDFLQRALGYALTGDTTEQVLFILYGPSGSNGKSTLLSTAVTLLGEYAVTTSPETFMVKDHTGGVPNDVARLKGARLVIAVETEAGHRRLDESLVKRVTGGDRLSARFMRGEWFDFAPTFKIFLATNAWPRVRGASNAIWRRLRLVPFTVTIPDAEQDHHLAEKLTAELPGILAWAVRGCLAWQRDGLGEPDAVREATNEYRAEMDSLKGFLADRCVDAPDATGLAKELYEAYVDWCKTTEEEAMTQNAFGRRMTERGYTRPPTKTARFYRGLRLKTESDLKTESEARARGEGDG